MTTRRHPQVPTTSQVTPGAAVNIVLKADQPTGRTVQGVVRDLLTRGNHPRGIKVRLADGRVGRVQSMAPGSTETSSSSSAAAATTTNPGGSSLGGGMLDTSLGEGPAQVQTYDISAGRAPKWGGKGGGPRGLDDEAGLPSQQIGLDAYVKQAKPKRAGRGKGKSAPASMDEDEEEQGGAALSQAPPEIVTCPVCATFEGDETAVAHHVATHFDTGS